MAPQSKLPEEPTELIEFLAPYPEAVQELTLAGRLRLLELVGPASEIFYDAVNAVCSGFTYTDNVRDNFLNLAVYSDHVTLIFPWGARLLDPEKRLRGEGKQVRHLRLSSLEILSDLYVVDLIQQAQAGATRPSERVEFARIVKVMNAPKRRPSPATPSL